MQVAQAQARRIPLNTERANDNGLRWFDRACASLNTPVERPVPAEASPPVEAFLGAYTVFYTAMFMKPAERSAVTKLGGVRKTRANPNSSLSAYYGARRVLDDFGSYLPPMKAVLQCLKGLRVMMIETSGTTASPKRKRSRGPKSISTASWPESAHLPCPSGAPPST